MGKILVTGAGGFIGRHLCEHLRAAGHPVLAAFHGRDGEQACRAGLGRPTTYHLDLADTRIAWADLLRDVHAIVHLAAHVHVPWPAALNSGAFHRINTDGTARLAEAAARHRIRRFLFLSSAGVHGSASKQRGGGGGECHSFRESDPLCPWNAYTQSKLAAERALQSVCMRHAMEFVILRAPLVFGPRVGSSFLRLMKGIDRGLPLPLRGIRARRSLVYVGNLVQLVERCLDAPPVANGTFLLCDFDAGVEELAVRLGTLLGRKARFWSCPPWLLATLAATRVPGGVLTRLTQSFLVDGTAIREALQWAPPVDLDSALRETVSWYRAAKAGKGAPT